MLTAGSAGVGKSCLIKRYCERRFVTKYLPTIGIDYGIAVWKPDHAPSLASTITPSANQEQPQKQQQQQQQPAPLVRVNFYDMAGDDVYYSVRNEFYENTQGILLVFDVHKRQSFEKLNAWLEELQSELGKSALDQCVVIVCANKVDVEAADAAAKGGQHSSHTTRPPSAATGGSASGRAATAPSKKAAGSMLSPTERSVTTGEGQLWAESRGFEYFETSALTGYQVEAMFHRLFQRVFATAELVELPASVNMAEPCFTHEDLDNVQRVLKAKDDYAVLDLKPGMADSASIQRSFRTMASQVHPDKCRVPEAEDAFKRVLQAKDRLSKALEL